MIGAFQHAVGRVAIGVAFAAALTAALTAALANTAGAQQPTRQPPATRAQTQRRPETIEIRGQVPTPQVVTVRPREAPTYSRRVLVPAFLDHRFWPSILPPLRIVSPVGSTRADSTSRAPADSASRAQPPAARPPSGTPPAPLER
jgi:hypothetical protein